MFNAASKMSFTVAVVAAAVGFGSVFVTSDRAGFTALVFAGVLAAAVGLAAFYYAPRDPVVPASAEVDAATVRSVDTGDLPRSSVWPLATAVAVCLLAVGAAVGKSVVAIGVGVAVLVAFLWLAQVWREHPSWTQAMTDRLNDRFVVPILLPVVVVVLAGAGAVSLSRVFLAVSVEAAPLIGGVIAFAILGAFYLISTRETLSKEVLTTIVTVSALLVIGAGVAGAVKGEREFHHAGGDEHGATHPSAFTIGAADLAFDTEELDLPANTEVDLEFTNEETAGILHNVAIYTERGGDDLFTGDLVDGGEEATYHLPPIDAGTYYFQCDVHPDMNGSVVVAEDATAPPDDGVNATTTSTAGH